MSSSGTNATLYPPPPTDSSCAPIEHPLKVTCVLTGDPDVFTNVYPLWMPPPGRALFGGILIGAAVSAAQQTVAPEFVISHMHCTFLVPPDTNKPLYYRVSRSSDQRSVASREVKAEQDGTIFFSAACSFSLAGRPSPVIHHAKVPELDQQGLEVPAPVDIPASNDKALTDQMIRPHFLMFKGPKTTREDVDPFYWRDYPPTQDPSTTPSVNNTLHSWVRSRGNMSDSQTSHMAVLGCLTDSWFLSGFPDMNPTAAGPGGKNIRFMISLNHTIWFHDPYVRLDDWLLVRRASSWAAEGRCLVEQQIWDSKGKLVATCVQEGALRLARPKI